MLGTNDYLDMKGMLKTTLTTASGATKSTWVYMVAVARPEPLLGDHDEEDLGIISFHPEGRPHQGSDEEDESYKDNRCKRPVLTDKEGKMKKKTPEMRYGGTMMDRPDLDGMNLKTWGDHKPLLPKNNEMFKAEPGREARHRNKVQDLRYTDKHLHGKPMPGDHTTHQEGGVAAEGGRGRGDPGGHHVRGRGHGAAWDAQGRGRGVPGQAQYQQPGH